jgi:hypothetical protein
MRICSTSSLVSPDARRVALLERRQRQVGEKERDRQNAALEVVVELGERARLLAPHLVVDLEAHEAARRRQNREPVHLVEHVVDAALGAPLAREPVDDGEHVVDVALQLRRHEPVLDELELLVHDLDRRVVHDALAEHGHHELVRLLGRRLRVVGAEEHRLRLRADQERHLEPDQRQREAVAQLLVARVQQAD